MAELNVRPALDIPAHHSATNTDDLDTRRVVGSPDRAFNSGVHCGGSGCDALDCGMRRGDVENDASKSGMHRGDARCGPFDSGRHCDHARSGWTRGRQSRPPYENPDNVISTRSTQVTLGPDSSTGAASKPAATHALRQPFCHHIARLAVRSLYAELALYPKPGLVSLVDNGSHADMSAATFLRSMFALRRYFLHITRAGMANAPFDELKRLGIAAEERMLRATGGINTHRGAIFCLGMLCAAIGRCRAAGVPLAPAAIRTTLRAHWGRALNAHGADIGTHTHGMQPDGAPPTQKPSTGDPSTGDPPNGDPANGRTPNKDLANITSPGHTPSHGTQALLRYAASGAREEAARGFPSVFETGLPALQGTLAADRGMRRARIDALFALMATISDTNVYHRGGVNGALTVRSRARSFVARGGTAAPGWEARALACHRDFVAARLSPGGAADLLGAVCLVHAVCGGEG